MTPAGKSEKTLTIRIVLPSVVCNFAAAEMVRPLARPTVPINVNSDVARLPTAIRRRTSIVTN